MCVYGHPLHPHRCFNLRSGVSSVAAVHRSSDTPLQFARHIGASTPPLALGTTSRPCAPPTYPNSARAPPNSDAHPAAAAPLRRLRSRPWLQRSDPHVYLLLSWRRRSFLRRSHPSFCPSLRDADSARRAPRASPHAVPSLSTSIRPPTCRLFAALALRHVSALVSLPSSHSGTYALYTLLAAARVPLIARLEHSPTLDLSFPA
jgi:hypothetical protein